MAKVPLRAKPAVVRLHGSIDVPAGPDPLAGLATRHVDGLRPARALAHGQVAVDEEAVVESGHAPSLETDRDNSCVAISLAPAAGAPPRHMRAGRLIRNLPAVERLPGRKLKGLDDRPGFLDEGLEVALDPGVHDHGDGVPIR